MRLGGRSCYVIGSWCAGMASAISAEPALGARAAAAAATAVVSLLRNRVFILGLGWPATKTIRAAPSAKVRGP